jgi:hypothetical protein
MLRGTRLYAHGEDMVLQRPLQVWLPETPLDLEAAHILRQVLIAYVVYRGQMIVVWDPGGREVRVSWWESESGQYNGLKLEIPGSATGVVEVFHVGRNGFVWGPHSFERFHEAQVSGLLDRWLQANLDDSAAWPKDIAVSLPPREPWPWESAAQQKMVAIAGLSSTNQVEALLTATNLAVPFVTEAYAYFRDAEVAPTMVKLGKGPTFFRLGGATSRGGGREIRPLLPRDPGLRQALEAKIPVVSDELKAALRDDPFRQEWLQLVPVRRCWGVEGLFWALLIDRLESGRPFNLCERCGRPLPKPRRLCGPNDNRECFTAQARERQRQARERQRQERLRR